jgi:hypothetical protein
MHTLGYSVWLGKMALDCVVYAWFITAPLVAFMLISSALSLRSVDQEKRKRMIRLPIVYLFPLMGLIIGSVFRAYRSVWPSYLLWIPVVGLVALAVVWVIRFKGMRVTVVSHSLLAFWMDVCVGFVASMAITDNWL